MDNRNAVNFLCPVQLKSRLPFSWHYFPHIFRLQPCVAHATGETLFYFVTHHCKIFLCFLSSKKEPAAVLTTCCHTSQIVIVHYDVPRRNGFSVVWSVGIKRPLYSIHPEYGRNLLIRLFLFNVLRILRRTLSLLYIEFVVWFRHRVNRSVWE